MECATLLQYIRERNMCPHMEGLPRMVGPLLKGGVVQKRLGRKGGANMHTCPLAVKKLGVGPRRVICCSRGVQDTASAHAW